VVGSRQCNGLILLSDRILMTDRGVGAQNVGAEAVEGEDDHSFDFRSASRGESER
jgi:hypothetical protein